MLRHLLIPTQQQQRQYLLKRPRGKLLQQIPRQEEHVYDYQKEHVYDNQKEHVYDYQKEHVCDYQKEHVYDY